MKWTAPERATLRSCSTPAKIQNFLDKLPYDAKPKGDSPRAVMKYRKAHCFGGALFAAAALQELGFSPLIMDLRAVNDDDHVLAVFKADGHWGAIAKSNFTILRFREPVYRTLRELAMSYFDFYFNSEGQKTLREFSVPLNLRKYPDWEIKEYPEMHGDLDRIRHYKILTNKMIKKLSRASKPVVTAGLLGANKAGLYRS